MNSLNLKLYILNVICSSLTHLYSDGPKLQHIKRRASKMDELSGNLVAFEAAKRTLLTGLIARFEGDAGLFKAITSLSNLQLSPKDDS